MSISKRSPGADERFTGADLEDLVRRAGLIALRRGLDRGGKVTMAEFEAALGETRASVTAEMEREYEQIQDTLKQDAARPTRRHRLRRAGHAHPAAGRKGLSRRARRPATREARAISSAGDAANGQRRPTAVERHAERRRGDIGDAVDRGDEPATAFCSSSGDRERGAAGEARPEKPKPSEASAKPSIIP